MMFRVCYISVLLCGLFWAADGTPAAVSTCLNLLTESARAGGLTPTERRQLADLTTKFPEHHVQRRTVHQHHGMSSGDVTSTPVGLQGVPELLQILRMVATFPVDALISMLNMTAPAHVDQESHLPMARHGLRNLSLSGLHSLLQSNSSSKGSQESSFALFNVTSAGNAARQAALFSERLLLSPVISLLALTRSANHTAALPPYLTSDYILRHMSHLGQYLGTGKETSTVAPIQVDQSTTQPNGTDVPTTTTEGHQTREITTEQLVVV